MAPVACVTSGMTQNLNDNKVTAVAICWPLSPAYPMALLYPRPTHFLSLFFISQSSHFLESYFCLTLHTTLSSISHITIHVQYTSTYHSLSNYSQSANITDANMITYQLYSHPHHQNLLLTPILEDTPSIPHELAVHDLTVALPKSSERKKAFNAFLNVTSHRLVQLTADQLDSLNVQRIVHEKRARAVFRAAVFHIVTSRVTQQLTSQRYWTAAEISTGIQLLRSEFESAVRIGMSRLPFLQTGALPALSEDAGAATSSPARGQEMRSNLLQKLRAPALVHSWSFWHDRQDRRKPAGATADAEDRYEDRLVMLHEIEDVKQFWSVYNNFELHNLQLKDSIHLFHRGTKPVWEDPRNVKGGAWTFRVPKEKAGEFWQQVSLLAVGEQLQAAVKDPKRVRFHDDICGVSYSVRFTSVLISVWNRDAENAAGIQKIKEVIFEALDQELVPKEGVYYYKKHSQHPGFRAPEGDASAAA